MLILLPESAKSFRQTPVKLLLDSMLALEDKDDQILRLYISALFLNKNQAWQDGSMDRDILLPRLTS